MIKMLFRARPTHKLRVWRGMMATRKKVSMTAFDLAKWISCAKGLLSGAKIVNVYNGAGNDLVLFKARLVNGDYKYVVVRPGAFMYLSSHEPDKAEKQSQLVLSLRKHVRGAFIKGLRQQGFDRVATLELSNGTRVVVELIPRGVVALLDSDGKILVASEYAEMKDRVIKRGQPYTLPPSNTIHPASLKREELVRRVSKGKDVVRGMVLGLGYPGEVAEEVLARAGVRKDLKPGELSEELAERIVGAVKEVLAETLSDCRGYILCDERGEPISVLPFAPRRLDVKFEAFDSFIEATDRYFTSLLVREPLKEQDRLAKAVERLRASISEQKKVIEKYEEESGEYERRAIALAANYAKVSAALECAWRVVKESGWHDLTKMCADITGYDEHAGKVLVKVGGMEVELDVRRDLDEIIVEYYRRSAELRKKAEKARSKLEELEGRLQELVSEKEAAERSKRLVKRVEWYERFHWLITSEGFLVIGGRDSSQNEALVRKYLEENDVFMHAEVHGAPAVVIKTGGRSPSERSLREAAVLAACYSKAWKEGLGYADVYWVQGDQVSKGPPPGEYLPKGSFMVYGKRNYIRGVKLELAIGIEVIGEAVRVVAGPRDLVKARSLAAVVLVPGPEKPSDVAKKVYKLLTSECKKRGLVVAGLTVDDVLRRVPGPSRVLPVASR